MIIGKELKKLLENSNNKIANKLLELETTNEDWIGGVDYVNVAIENPTKISYITKDRLNRFKLPKQFIPVIPVGKVVSLKKSSRYYKEDLGAKVTITYTERCPVTLIESEGIDNLYIYKVEYSNGETMYVNTQDICRYNLYKKISESVIEDKMFDADYRLKYAYMTTPGKFINKLNLGFSDKDVQEFLNVFYQEDTVLKIEGVYFEEVTGRSIMDAYDEENYLNTDGNLGSSCMRYEECQDYVKLYADYPDIISCLVLKSYNDNLVCGRAIVWKCETSDGESITFMDRIYVSNSNFEQFFKNYAIKNNWWYKASQTYSEYKTFYTPKNNYSDIVNYKICISLDNAVDKSFPYLDTFASGKIVDSYVYLENTNSLEFNFQDTEGGPLTEGVYSEWLDRTLFGNTVYSNYLSSYLPQEDSVYLEYIDDYMPDDYDGLEEINGNWFFQKDCTWSEYYDAYIHQDIEGIVDTNEGYVYEHDAVYSDYLEEYLIEDNAVWSNYHNSWMASSDVIEYNGDWVHEDIYDELIEEENKKEEVNA